MYFRSIFFLKRMEIFFSKKKIKKYKFFLSLNKSLHNFLFYFNILTNIRSIFFFFKISQNKNIEKNFMKKKKKNFKLVANKISEKFISKFLENKKNFFYFFKKLKININSNDKKNIYKICFFLDFEYHKEIFIPITKDNYSIKKGLNIFFIPFWLRYSIFNLKNLNYIQTKIFPFGFGSDVNLLICSPTGTGKTTCSLFCIFRIVMNSMDLDKSNLKVINKFIKILYIAPMKMLVREIAKNFEKNLKNLKFNILEITGDILLLTKNLFVSNIIIGTPEKIEILSRKENYVNFFSEIKLLIVDEIHFLNEGRGPVLEQLLMRFLIKNKPKKINCRLICFSATIPNFKDVGKFLQINLEKGLFYFNNLFRQIPLKTNLIGLKQFYSKEKNKNLINQIVCKKIFGIFKINKTVKIIIFVQNRKDTLKTALFIFSKFQKGTKKSEIYNNFQNMFLIVKNLIKKRIFIHHAGFSKEKKFLIEKFFRKGKIKILIATTTLAWGVNVPATHCIIKGTRIYCPQKFCWDEISDLNVIQMLGRAGRFIQTNDSNAIIITSLKNCIHYLNLINFQLPIESRVIDFLPDLFNCECSSYKIQNIISALNWFSKTLLFIRLQRIIVQKKLKNKNLISLVYIKHLFISQIIRELKSSGLLILKLEKGIFFPTSIGMIASEFLINHQTILILMQNIKATLNMNEIIELFSYCAEFSNMKVRAKEKLELLRIEKMVNFPVKKKIIESAFKANILLQSLMQNIRIFNFTLLADTIFVGKTSRRISRGLFEIMIKKRWASMTSYCFNIYQIIQNKFTDNQISLNLFKTDPSKNKFIQNIKEEKIIDSKNFKHSDKERSPNSLNSKNTIFFLKKIINSSPKIDLSIHLKPITRNTIKLCIMLKINYFCPEQKFNSKIGCWIFLEDQICDTLIAFHYCSFQKFQIGQKLFINFLIPIFDNPISPYYNLKIKSEQNYKLNLEIPINLCNINFPINHSLYTKCLKFYSTPFSRILNGFFAGLILIEYYQTHLFEIKGFFYQFIPFILKNVGQKILSFIQIKLKFIFKEFSLISFFSKLEKFLFLFFSCGLESLNLKKIKFQNSSMGFLGISVENFKKKNFFKKFFEKKISFLTLSLFEWFLIKLNLKNLLCGKIVFIIDFFSLMKNKNFGNGIEILCEEIKYKLFLKSELFIIGSTLPFSNLFEFFDWLNFKKGEIFCFQNFLKFKFLNNTKFIKNKHYFKKIFWIIEKNKKNLGILALNIEKNEPKNILIEYISDLILQFISLIQNYSIFSHKRLSLFWKENFIIKFLMQFKIGLLIEYWKFYKRRWVEECFSSNFFKIIFLSINVFGIIGSDKLSSKETILLKFIHLDNFVQEKSEKIKIFLKKKNFVINSYANFLFPIESFWLKFANESLMQFIFLKNQIEIFHLENKILSTLYFLRVNQNPQFYGFIKRPNFTFLARKLTYLLVENLTKLKLIYKKKKIKGSFFGFLTLNFLFLKNSKKILFFCFKKNITIKKILNFLKKSGELQFLETCVSMQHFFEKKFYSFKNLFIKFFKKISKNILHFTSILKKILERLFSGFIILINYLQKKLNLCLFLFEIKQIILTENFNKNSTILQILNLEMLQFFFLAKIHRIFSLGSLKEKIYYFLSINKSKYQKKFLKTFFEFFDILKNLSLSISFRKNNNNNFIIINIDNTFFNNIKKKFFFKKKIFFEKISICFWIIIGNLKKNQIFFFKKIYFKDFILKFNFIKKKKTKNFKIFILNEKFPLLNQEANIELLN
jgi:replicative superfamily II helicase